MTSDDTKWLDERYLQKVLRDSEKDESIEVSRVTIKPAASIGDNYGSDMTRIFVDFSRIQNGKKITNNVSLIAKVMPQSGMRYETISSGSYFETEMSMFLNTLPKMVEILKEITTPTIAPQCFYLQYEKPVHLIMEDLMPSGFRMFDQNTGLDLDHCLLAIRNLALFHASSVALKEKDSDAAMNYKKGVLYKDHPPGLATFFKAGTKTLGELTSQWPELNKRISEKLIKLSDVVVEKGREASLFREDDFNVVNHGDFWVNNMMFRYNDQGKPIGHIFVDFQFSYYGSPVLDLLYFLSLNPSDDVRMNYRELLLREYHDLLTSTMVKLKCSTEVPRFDKLKKMMKERGRFPLAPCSSILPLILADKTEAKSFEDMLAPDVRIQHPGYEGELFRKIMTRALSEYDSMGLLDV